MSSSLGRTLPLRQGGRHKKMLKKIFIAGILTLAAGVGLYAIAVLSGRIELPSEEPVTNQEFQIQEYVSEEMQSPVEEVKQVLNLDKPNDIVFGEVRPANFLVLESVKIEQNGFAVVYESENPKPSDVLGFSSFLHKGKTENVLINLKRSLSQGEKIFVGHRLDDGDGFFEISGRYDKNVARADGKLLLFEANVE